MDVAHAAEALVKEAGLGRDMKAWVLKRHRAAKKLIREADNAQRAVGLKFYSKLPVAAQSALVNPRIMDPSDQTFGAVAEGAKKLLKLGSAKKRK